MILRHIFILLFLFFTNIAYASGQVKNIGMDQDEYYKQMKEAKELVMEFEKNFFEMRITEGMESSVLPEGPYTAAEGVYYRQFARVMAEKIVEKLQEDNRLGTIGENLLERVDDMLREKYGIKSAADGQIPNNTKINGNNKNIGNIEKKAKLQYNSAINGEGGHEYKRHSKEGGYENIKSISKDIRSRPRSK